MRVVVLVTDVLAAAGTVAGDGSFTEAVLRWAKVESTWGLVLVIFGIFAQAMFFMRWLIQWIASERKGESHMPDLFWWLSLAGASLLLVYFILRGEPVGVLGQSVGWIVYGRNLYLIKKKRREAIELEEIKHGGAKSS